MERKQIVYINEIKFVCDVVENLCENNDIACFTLQEVLDFTYLINDLKPSIVIIDEKLYSKEAQKFWSEVEAADHKCKTMIIGPQSEKFDYFHNGKIDVITFGNILKNHLK